MAFGVGFDGDLEPNKPLFSIKGKKGKNASFGVLRFIGSGSSGESG